eukprot:TRINITY_DN8730_c0_g3_i1.p1 TRINITY_DN8730_c0_g3~~TRINITY_DN8730_c0_g3_i1.p1  ORF type:complete len:659 (+),score=127.52 TRINITY_DN8730_c0_g3_i1:64-1977(+)
MSVTAEMPMPTVEQSDVSEATPGGKAKVVGVMGGSFNPIHLGHALLAITVKETKPVDEVVLVPVFKHPVKRDLLPFEDRLTMCKLAVCGNGIKVSDIEQEAGASNAVMLRTLRSKYPAGSKLLWVCGDDVFEWIDNELGRAMLCELDGLIVQRRLRKFSDGQMDRFYKAPVDSDKVSALGAEHGVKVDFMYGELPHYSSTLVRNSPASWRAFLPQKVAAFLDRRPCLLAELVRTGDAPALHATPPASPNSAMLFSPPSSPQSTLSLPKSELLPTLESDKLQVEEYADVMPRLLRSEKLPEQKGRRANQRSEKQKRQEASTACIMRCLSLIHALQKERGHTALVLALKSEAERADTLSELQECRAGTDQLLKKGRDEGFLLSGDDKPSSTLAVAQELHRTTSWLQHDRAMLDREIAANTLGQNGATRWLQHASLLDKFNVRVDVLIDACTRALGEILYTDDRSSAEAVGNPSNPTMLATSRPGDSSGDWLLLLFQQYAHAKEALGRLRSFVSAGGENAPMLVQSSFRLRRRLNEVIEHKDRMLERVYSVEKGCPSSMEHPGAFTAAALYKMLKSVARLEYQLMGCFARSTPLDWMHEVLASSSGDFNVDECAETLSSAIDLVVKLDQALAVFICTLHA